MCNISLKNSEYRLDNHSNIVYTVITVKEDMRQAKADEVSESRTKNATQEWERDSNVQQSSQDQLNTTRRLP